MSFEQIDSEYVSYEEIDSEYVSFKQINSKCLINKVAACIFLNK